METFSRKNVRKILGVNFKSMRMETGLTKEGVANALNLSISYILMIERGEANISSKTAEKICTFFEIEMFQLYSEKIIRLKPISKLRNVEKFYIENINNKKFFIAKRVEYSVAEFIRKCIIPDKIIENYLSVKEIKNIVFNKYNRKVSSQELSRELRRAYIRGELLRKDKFGNGSVFEYKNL